MDPVGTIHSGLVGDLVASVHDGGLGVVLFEKEERPYILNELVATDREGAGLSSIRRVFVS